MKDIKEYFAEPSKKNFEENRTKNEGTPSKPGKNSQPKEKPDNSENAKDAFEENQKKKRKYRKKGKRRISSVSKIKNSSKSEENQDNSDNSKAMTEEDRKRKRKKLKENEYSDLAQNVTNLSSNCLNNSAGNIDCGDVLENNSNTDVPETHNEPGTENKLNAFQFMMDKRNKSIGMNSPGKSLIDSDRSEDAKLIKDKLAVRRNLLNDWAEKRGASKRKRNEEDRDVIINHKLEKRAKRLKKLLKANKVTNEDDDSADSIVKKKRKRVKQISCSSNSNDLVIVDTGTRKPSDGKITALNFKGVINEIIDNDTMERTKVEKRKSVKNEKSESKTVSCEGDLGNKKSFQTTTNSENFVEENAQDNVLNASKSKVPKQSLLTFFGVINKAKKADEECSESKEIVKRKASILKSKKTKLEIKNNKIIKKSKKKHMKTSLEKDTDNSTSDSKHNIAEENFSTISICEDNDTINIDNKDSPGSNYSQGSLSVKSSINLKLKNKSKKKINRKPAKLEKNISESSQESVITPRTLRSWKMRIRINLEDDNTKIEDRDKNKENPDDHATYNVINCEDEEYFADENSSDENSRSTLNNKHNNVPHSVNIVLSSDSEVESKSKKQDKKLLKVAPVFVKSTPKPKLDPEIAEARKQFLMSGIPASLKKIVEKQQTIEEKEYEIFPTVSHVQQKCDSPFWNLANPGLNLKDFSPLKVIDSDLPFKNFTKCHIDNKLNIQTELEKVDKLKILLNKIKADNPNYPVYKSFRLIYEKTGKTLQGKKEPSPVKPKKRGRKKLTKNIHRKDLPKPDADLVAYSMWTEKYKPKSSEDIAGNTEAVKNLKKWLVSWMKFSETIDSKKRRRDSSSSEFETTDCDSRDSISRLPGTTIVLGGPCGSGKSSAVYAICNELGFNVIELNASSKRTGKRLVQELQEATQSHQVRKGDTQNLQNFVQKNNFPDKSGAKETPSEKKMCVLLVEDVDIVFEQDEGFISALTQLVTTSKRPIVLTTTDYGSIFVQRFLSQYEYVPFLPLSSHSLASWLQIVCLIEGIFVDLSHIGALLEYNKGDARKTLLELQFWVQSGGQIIRNEMAIKIEHKCNGSEEKIGEDEQLNGFFEGESSGERDDIFVHKNCIRSFEIFDNYEPYNVPYFLNLGLIWWNLPNILNIPNFSKQRRERIKQETEIITAQKTKTKTKSTFTDKMKLHSLRNILDSLAFTDVMFRKTNYFDCVEPIVRNYGAEIKDSLELDERLNGFDVDLEFMHQVTHCLVNGFIGEYNGIEEAESRLHMAVPDRAERRWRAKHHVCEDIFQEAIPVSSHLERKSASMDYMPVLRNISRSEVRRAANNTKRGNRFRNYLKDLGVNYNDSTVKMACNILRDNCSF